MRAIKTEDSKPCSRKHLFALSFLFIIMVQSALFAADTTSYVSFSPVKGAFTLFADGKPTTLFVNEADEKGVILALKNLQKDIKSVTNAEPSLVIGTKAPKETTLVIVGTMGKSPLIDQLVKNKKLEVSGLKGKWETFVTQIVEKPIKGVERALVIAGSDKRGTIFGIYDLSEKIGVSPWYWWADVPVEHHDQLYVLPGKHTLGEPAVKYRGIFINDEAPALSGWAYEKFGGFNHQFYEHVFELILRLKGNYLWPAMWGRQFYVDDTLNPVLANAYGVVIGTSHHEPLMRAHAEWEHFGEGAWDYKTNEKKLQSFWREGMERMGDNESLVTVGMRGDGDEPMSEGTEITLLEKIVADQRKIIADVTGKAPEKTPQVWALYKEVQDYYDKGMRVPDDVTLLLADDNWGNIRKLPKLGDSLRAGGYGIYYHFDYVGGPRNYKWINTNPIARVWEQMHLAYKYKANQIWIVNVGDIKPMEFPTSFFLDYAWNPEKWPAEQLPDYTRSWAAQQFGKEYAEEIAEIITTYAKYNSRRKPELLGPETYSLVNYQEASQVVEDYNQLAANAEKLYQALPNQYKDAYYQLVLYPVKASANLNELHVTVAKNRLYAQQGRAKTNELAGKVKELFEKDSILSAEYHALGNGKWNHMMDQTHISYTYWQQPEKDVLPKVEKIELPFSASLGVAIEGSASWWPKEEGKAVLPEFSPYQKQKHYLEIFNRGQKSFQYAVNAPVDWIKVSPSSGNIDKQQRIWLNVEWEKAPKGKQDVPIIIKGPDNQQVSVVMKIHNPEGIETEKFKGFVEAGGYVSMEAEHFTKAVEKGDIHWQVIPDLGRTLSGVTAVPVTTADQNPKGDSPHLEYKMYLFDSGEVKVATYLSPTLNFHNDQGLRYAISFDDEEPQIVNINADKTPGAWEKEVANNIKILTSTHTIGMPGVHTLKFWMVSHGVVLQKIVVGADEIKPSYLGPPESFDRK